MAQPHTGALSLNEYLAERLQSGVAEICTWVRDGRVRASGVPVDAVRESRAREIRQSEMSAPMTIGADGFLYQGPNKKGPAWRAVMCRGQILCTAGMKQTGHVWRWPNRCPSSRRHPSEKGGRTRERAKRALDALYPRRAPDASSVPNHQLLTGLNQYLTTHDFKVVKLDSLLRAAGRR